MNRLPRHDSGCFERGRHSQPRFLPDGRHFLFYVSGSAETTGVHIGQLDNLDSRRLLGADSAAVYTATGHLLFVRDEKLLAQRFDKERLELVGEPFPIVEHVGGGIAMSAAAAGPVVYRTVSRDSGQRQLLWVDRSGNETQRVMYPDTQSLAPSLSRDGRKVAVFRLAMGNSDIWSYDIGRRAWDRLTVHPGDEIHPLWSPDGSRIIFGARRGQMDLYSKDLNTPAGSGEELLLATNGPKFPMDWSRDGRVPAVQQHRSEAGSRHLGAAARRRAEATCGRADGVQRTAPAALSGWQVDGVPIQQDGSIRGLHPAVSRSRKRRARVDRGRRTGPLESRWQRSFSISRPTID